MKAKETLRCGDAQTLLHAYVDGEADLGSCLAVEEHLQTCADCRQFHQNLVTLQNGLRAQGLYRSAPEGLTARLRRAGETPVAAPRMPQLVPWTVAGATSLAALLLLVLSPRPTDAERVFLEREVVSAYARSLLTHHASDVLSSDRHTVKPWFQGKIDFAPPVVDLAASGTPLVGGRLDYLEGRPVAVLVYASQKHVIQLFVWPRKPGADTASGAETVSTRQGYNLVRWAHADLQFWAASDVNAVDLTAFARRFRDATEPHGPPP